MANQSSVPGEVTRPKETRIATDPYRPVMGAMPSDDTPLIIKVSDELPTISKVSSYHGILCYERAGLRDGAGLTGRDHPRRSRASRLPLSKYELRGLPEIACSAAKAYAHMSCAITPGSSKLTILADSE